MKGLTAMRTATIEIYKYEELSDAAKEKAREWFREANQNDGYAWESENQDTLKAFLDMFDCQLRRDFCRCNDSDIGELSGLKLHKYLTANFYSEIFKPKQYWICQGIKNCVGSGAKKRESNIFVNPYNCSLTGYCMDNEILEPVINFILKPNVNTCFDDLMDSCFEAYKKAVQKDRDFQDSDEYIEESIIANEYEFTADGKIY